MYPLKDSSGCLHLIAQLKKGKRKSDYMDPRLKRLLNNKYGVEVIEEANRQNKLLHLIFSSNEIQAKIALCMVMYGADFEYSLAASLRLCPEN